MMELSMQPQLDFTQARFGGSDYDVNRDLARMVGAMGRVYKTMASCPERWFTLQDIARISGVPQSSVGSYLCYLRRDFHYRVPKRHVKDGLFEYRLGGKFNAGEMTEREIKKLKPIGDKALFGEMMRCMYAFAHTESADNRSGMNEALAAWAGDFVEKIRGQSEGVISDGQ